jgi:hypothetical protein
VATFDSALRLYLTNAEVRETNFEKLSVVDQPVKTIRAQHRGRSASEASEEEADNLSPKLQLCVGARVMLTTKLWTEMDLWVVSRTLPCTRARIFRLSHSYWSSLTLIQVRISHNVAQE